MRRQFRRKSKRFNEEQIAFALRQAESGTPIKAVCRKIQFSEQMFYRWKRKYVGMGVAEVRRLPVRIKPFTDEQLEYERKVEEYLRSKTG